MLRFSLLLFLFTSNVYATPFEESKFGLKILELENSNNSQDYMETLNREYDYLRALNSDSSSSAAALVSSIDYDLKEGVSREIDELILSKGKAILPLLKQRMKERNSCIGSIYPCSSDETRSDRFKMLMKYINEGVTSIY